MMYCFLCTVIFFIFYKMECGNSLIWLISWCLFIAYLLSKSFHCLLKSKLGNAVVWLLYTLFLFYVSVGDFNLRIIWSMAKEIFLIFWPVAILAVAMYFRRNNLQIGVWHYGEAAFYLSMIFLIWFFERRIVPDSYLEYDHKMEIIEGVYLWITGLVAWYLTEQEKSEKGLEQSVKTIVLPIVSLFILFWNHRRLWDIIGSLFNPFSSVAGNIEEVNWLSNRLECIRLIWTAELEWSLEQKKYWQLIHPTYMEGKSPLQIIISIIIELLILYLIYIRYKKCCFKESNMQDKKLFIKIVYFALNIWSILGIIGMLLLVSSTRITMITSLNHMNCILIALFYIITFQKNRKDGGDLYGFKS